MVNISYSNSDDGQLSEERDGVANYTGLMSFAVWYADIHGVTSVLVCSFGIVTNIFNISVLTRRDMATSTNIILTWLAVSDLLTMVSYIPFALHFYTFSSPSVVTPDKNNYTWMVFMLVHINFGATAHTISIWLGVALSISRYMQLKSTSRGSQTHRRRLRTARIITAFIYIVSVIGMIPNYLSNELIEKHINFNGENRTFYTMKDLNLASDHTDTIVLVNVVSYGLFAKLIPCILMCVFGGALLYNLGVKGETRRRRLSRMSSTSSTGSRCASAHSRTTSMLLVVLILFLITEFPQAILIFLSISVRGFFNNIYLPLGDLMDFIALLNNAVNFLLYCSMSQQFRSRFLDMYCQSAGRRLSFVRNMSFRGSLTSQVKTASYKKQQPLSEFQYSSVACGEMSNGTDVNHTTVSVWNPSTFVTELVSTHEPRTPTPATPLHTTQSDNFLQVPCKRANAKCPE